MTGVLIEFDPCVYPVHLVEHRHSSLFSSPCWIAAVANGYGLKIAASVPSGGGPIENAILFSHIADIRGDRVVCLPFSDYCDPLVDNLQSWQALVRPIQTLGAPIRLRCLRNRVPTEDPEFTVHGSAMWHGVDLTLGEEALWRQLGSSARRNIRKAERCGVTIREGNSFDDVRRFHALHVQLRKTKYRMLAQPVAFFDSLHEFFAPDDRIRVLFAELEGVPIAGIVLLEWQGVLYYKFNASIDQRLRPNDLLAWHALLLGKRRACHLLDFGLSATGQPGLIRYKQKFATEETDICFLQWQPEAYADPRAAQVSKALGRMTEFLTDPSVPDEITVAAGNDFYRFFA